MKKMEDKEHICPKCGIIMYRRYNSSIYTCPACLIKKNRALFNKSYMKNDNAPTGLKKTSKRKRSEKSRAMRRADKWFSWYIRLKYSFEQGGELFCKCYTCGRIHGIKDIELGHFQRRGYLTTRYDENNGRPQCTYCNRYHSGEPEKFELKLIKDVGQKEVDRLKRTAQEEGEGSLEFFREQSDKFRKLFNKLLKEKCIKNPWTSQ